MRQIVEKVSLQSFIGSWSPTMEPDLVHDRIAAFGTTIKNLECFNATLFFVAFLVVNHF